MKWSWNAGVSQDKWSWLMMSSNWSCEFLWKQFLTYKLHTSRVTKAKVSAIIMSYQWLLPIPGFSFITYMVLVRVHNSPSTDRECKKSPMCNNKLKQNVADGWCTVFSRLLSITWVIFNSAGYVRNTGRL